MIFNSVDFCVFLPIVFILYWTLFGSNLKLQNFFIVIVSYLFYGWWDWRFLFLIALTTFCSWISGYLIGRFRNSYLLSISIPKLVSLSNIVLNIGILIFFKYFNFFIESFVDVFSLFGCEFNISTLRIILPVGISFYTFQALSYSIDVYKRRIEPTKDIVAFFAYVSFFPQLVAGPIERATNLLPQFYKKKTFDFNQAFEGSRQIVWGFFKKMVVGDTCALVVDSTFNNYHELSGSTLLLGAIFFSFQIYGDFSGYSDIAIGVSKLFGVELKKNFNVPYFSRNIAEFWSRWHISLQRWFIDYIYIPLGGSREGLAKTQRNTLVVFAISGLWHGANWTFVIWGLYHAFLLIILNLFTRKKKYDNVVAYGKMIPSFSELVKMIFTYSLVVFGWIFFRAQSLGDALLYCKGIFDKSLFTIPKFLGHINAEAVISLLFIMFMLCVEWLTRDKEHPLLKQTWSTGLLTILLLIFIYFFGVNSSSFIYFQF